MSVLSATTQQQVEEKLVENKLLPQEKLDEIKDKAEKAGTPLFSLLVSEGHISNEMLTKTIAHVTKVPYVNLTKAKIDPEILQLLPQDIAERYMAVPLGEMQHRLVVAMLDADNIQAADFLSNKIGRPLKVYAASEEGIRQVLAQYKAQISKELAGSFDEQEEVENIVVKPGESKAQAIESMVQDSPISKILTAILEYAAKNRASDIHIEPLEKELKVRCRVDGVMREVMKLPKATEPPIVSRIKILSNLKIDEHRIPQDGQFTVTVNKRPADVSHIFKLKSSARFV